MSDRLQAGLATLLLVSAAQTASAHGGHRGAPALKAEVLFTDPSPSGDASAAAPQESGSSAAERILVVLANFRNDKREPVSPREAGGLVSQVADLFREASYGKSDMGVEVFGWTALPMDARCDDGKIKEEAIKAADPEVDFRRFGRVVILFPNPEEPCKFGGLGSMGRWRIKTGEGHRSLSVTWLPLRPGQVDDSRDWTLAVLAQELGHNMGLEHASTLSCGKAPLGSNCTDEEYGDPIDPMGGGGPHHFNAVYKRKLGWISQGQVATVERRKGVYSYRLSPLETRGGLKLLRVPSSPKAPFGGADYLLEFRQPIGWDAAGIEASNFQGALVRVLLESNHREKEESFWQRLPLIGRLFGGERSYKHAHLLDMDGSLEDGYALGAGREWTDPGRDVSIKVVGIVDGQLEVVVTIGVPTFNDFVAGIFDGVSGFLHRLVGGGSEPAAALARSESAASALAVPRATFGRSEASDTTRFIAPDEEDGVVVAAPVRSAAGIMEFRSAAPIAKSHRQSCGGFRQIPWPLRGDFDEEAAARGVVSPVSCLSSGEYLANRVHAALLASGDRDGAAEAFAWEGFLSLRAARAVVLARGEGRD